MELGGGGSVVLLLTDHIALSGEGHDLVVFGNFKGPLKVEVSLDAENWTTATTAGPGIFEFGNVKKGVRYVRLTAQAGGKGGTTIDSVGAVRVRPIR